MHNIESLLLTQTFFALFKGFGFSPNLLEANVVNIAILIFGVFYLGGGALIPILELRKQTILESIQEAEEKLEQASLKFVGAEKRLSHSKTLVKQLKDEAEFSAKRLKEEILTQGKLDIDSLMRCGIGSIKSAELLTKRQIQRRLVELTLKRVECQLQNCVTHSLQTKLIDSNLSQFRNQV